MAIISNATTIADAGSFSVGLGSIVLIKTIAITSNTSTVDFVHGSSSVVLDGTYPIYRFDVINAHPAAAGVEFKVGFRDGGSDFDAVKTTTIFTCQHVNGSTNLEHVNAEDLAQSTALQALTVASQVGTDNDEGTSGSLLLYDPANTTHAKYFHSDFSYVSNDATHGCYHNQGSGCLNTTTAIDGVRFQFTSNNIGSGVFKLYGIKDS